MKADVALACTFINACVGPYHHRFRTALVQRHNLQRNKAGKIVFRIDKSCFPSRDTQYEMLKRLTKVLGQPTETYSEQLRHVYRWEFSATRALSLTWQYNSGTYATLTDTENI